MALLVGMTFARQGNDSNSRGRGGLPGGALAYAFLRVVGDALFWTFHPWSPFSVYYRGSARLGAAYGGRRRAAGATGPKVPLYERVNRFFFGPPAAAGGSHARTSAWCSPPSARARGASAWPT